MSWFEDLSPFSYGDSEPGTLNVGWLDAGHPFRTADPDQVFLLKLARLCDEHRVRVARGWHWCELCPRTPESRGDAEIRVRQRDGVIFAAPTLVGHYVRRHRYLPPRPFVEAVLADPRVAGTI